MYSRLVVTGGMLKNSKELLREFVLQSTTL